MTMSPENAVETSRAGRRQLDVFFFPTSVAVIGATESPGSVGRTVLWNILHNPFGGTVFPVNPNRSSVLGVRAYPSLAAVPAAVDLAVIVTPAPTVPDLIGECVAAGVRGAIIISAGFKEAGPGGVELERQIRERLRGGRMRVIGPNCLGVMSPVSGLQATFAADMARRGGVAFLSQSGAMLTAALDWSLRENVGFSAFVSVGSMLDVGWGHLIDYLGEDPNTQSIVIYMESVGDARSFLSAARAVTVRKPVIVLKAGRTEVAASAAASHTGTLVGSDEVLEAAFRRAGVLRVDSIGDVFEICEVLAKQPRPRGPRLTILSNAGGPGVLATDALLALGGKLARLEPGTVNALNEMLPLHWSHGNPVDILSDADPERYARACSLLSRDTSSDGLLVILTPTALTDPTQVAEQLVQAARTVGKPILASWMGGERVDGGVAVLNRAGIPTLPYPDTAARMFCYMWNYTYNLRGIYETPVLPARSDSEETENGGSALVEAVRRTGRTLLTELESKQLLAAYHIPVVATHLATTEAEAVERAERMGYPVVLKLHSHTLTHKTEVGGVRLGLADAEAVRSAYREIEISVREKAGPGHFAGVTVQPMVTLDGYEVILGSSIDPQFGPVLLFGTGGRLVDVFRDRALALPPLNTTLARRLLEHTRIYTALNGINGRKPVNLPALEALLVRFSQLVVEQPWIREIDINPLLVGAEEIVALDARVVLHDPSTPPASLPRPAIRPYPSQYVSSWSLPDGSPLVIRPIRPEDEPLLVAFHETLSDESVYLRYLQMFKLSRRVEHEQLAHLCFIDYDRGMTLVAERVDPTTRARRVIAVGQLMTYPGTREAEFALIVSDPFQHRGLGTELLRRLLEVGWQENLQRIVGWVHPENQRLLHVCAKLGFRLVHDPRERLVVVSIQRPVREGGSTEALSGIPVTNRTTEGSSTSPLSQESAVNRLLPPR